MGDDVICMTGAEPMLAGHFDRFGRPVRGVHERNVAQMELNKRAEKLADAVARSLAAPDSQVVRSRLKLALASYNKAHKGLMEKVDV